MTIMLTIEVISGIAALLFTAMAFTHFLWAEGAAAQALQRESKIRAKRLFVAAGVLWALCFGCYVFLRWEAGTAPPGIPPGNPPGMQGGYQE